MAKLLILLLAVAIVPTAFAGGGSERAASATGALVIDYAFWGNPTAIGVEEDIINEYHASQSRIRIAPVVSGYTGYHDMLLTQLAGGSGPDVLRVDSYYFADFAELGALRPIDDLIARDNIDMGVYYQLGVIENTYEGQIYGLPWGTAPLYMFINLDMFEAAGIPVPANDWTLDDFERIARQLTSGNSFGWGMTTGNLSQVFPFIWAKGGDVFSSDRSRFTLNSNESIEGLELLARLVADGIVPRDGILGDAELLNELFVNDRLGMRMGAASEILSMQAAGKRFEAINMPTGVVKDTTVNKSNIIGINRNSRNVDEVWEFIKFLRAPGQRGEELYMAARRMPPTQNVAALWDIYAGSGSYPTDVRLQTELINDQYGRLMPLRPGWLELENLVMPEIQGILLGEVSAREAMNGIAAEAQAILDRR